MLFRRHGQKKKWRKCCANLVAGFSLLLFLSCQDELRQSKSSRKFLLLAYDCVCVFCFSLLFALNINQECNTVGVCVCVLVLFILSSTSTSFQLNFIN